MSQPEYSFDARESIRSRPPHVPVESKSSGSFSLSFLFMVLTSCALFFTCLEFSPLLAIGTTVLLTPALMRTAWIVDTSRRLGKPVGWRGRSRFLLKSIAIMLLIAIFAASVFALVCMLFGLFGWALNLMVAAAADAGDAIVVGAAGGIIWGVAAAMLAGLFALTRIWVPDELKSLQAQQSRL